MNSVRFEMKKKNLKGDQDAKQHAAGHERTYYTMGAVPRQSFERSAQGDRVKVKGIERRYSACESTDSNAGWPLSPRRSDRDLGALADH